MPPMIAGYIGRRKYPFRNPIKCAAVTFHLNQFGSACVCEYDNVPVRVQSIFKCNKFCKYHKIPIEPIGPSGVATDGGGGDVVVRWA